MTANRSKRRVFDGGNHCKSNKKS